MKKKLIICYMCQGLNSHYFHIIGDGHQPNGRGSHTDYKDSYWRWDDHPQYSDFWPWHIYGHCIGSLSNNQYFMGKVRQWDFFSLGSPFAQPFVRPLFGSTKGPLISSSLAWRLKPAPQRHLKHPLHWDWHRRWRLHSPQPHGRTWRA